MTNEIKTSEDNKDKSFPIVGIGASAGGLEAFEGFFVSMPVDSNMAFIIIQHLDPKHKSMMGELLQKVTTMKILEIKDGMEVEPDTIYLNPASMNVGMFNRTFRLMTPVKTQGINLPIDYFFRSLALDQGNRAVCIILSGTGSDGTLGLKAVKGAGGMNMVQEESQARYDGMPHSAIDTGMVDFILPVEKMSEYLQKYARHPYVANQMETPVFEKQKENFMEKIFILLRSQVGHDFSGYKETTIHRRIERRMAVHRVNRLADYVDYLHKTPDEIQKLFKDMLIGVTNFFRDPGVFENLQKTALPDLIKNSSANVPIRVWVPGCSTGEEAYSIAMLLLETMETVKTYREVQIFASDLDNSAIEIARRGVYPESIAADISPERLNRFFTREDNTYKLKKKIREMVVFALQNLVKDPPFSRLHMVSCRNVMIYLKANLQKRIFPLFHYVLISKGILLLGPSESIGEFSNLFSALDLKSKIYQRKGVIEDRIPEYTMIPFFEGIPTSQGIQGLESAKSIKKFEIRNLIEKIIVDDYSPPCVIINEKNRIIYTTGDVDKYLMFPSGNPSLDILETCRHGLKQKLRTALRDISKQKHMIKYKDLRVTQNNIVRNIDLLVRPLSEPAFTQGMTLIVFMDRTPPLHSAPESSIKKESDKYGKTGQYTESLEIELQSTKESLQSTIEELETSNEELKSTNEEFQSVNEEIQSSNEELKTSKEELQSTNEELTTVNTELQLKVDELSTVNNDISNLLASTSIGTIFLNTDLKIKRFTPAMKKIFNLISTDIDRPVSDITSSLEYDSLYDDAKKVLDTLERKDAHIRDKDGRWYSMSITPYRTVDNIIDGVVITFVDITEIKLAKEKQQEALLILAESILNAVQSPLLVMNGDLSILTVNKAFCRFFKVTQEETVNRRLYDLSKGQWDIPKLRELLEDIIPKNTSFKDFRVEHDFPAIGRKKMLLNARRIDREGQIHMILLAIEDVTEKQTQKEEIQ